MHTKVLNPNIPELEICLILLLSVSATNTPPNKFTETPRGLLNLAVVPIPSPYDAMPDPATVDTTPDITTTEMKIWNLKSDFSFL